MKLTGGTALTSKARRLGAGLIAIAIAGTLGACSSEPSPDTSPEGLAETTTRAFLDELAAGNHKAALGFTTSSRDDFACLSLTEDIRRGTISKPDVESVTVDGTTATVEARYFVSPYGDVQQTFTLEQAGDGWLVVLPDIYRIVFEFDAPTIATLGINRITGLSENPDECQITVTDGAAETLALPGTYMVDIVDTSGVFTPDRQRGAPVGDYFAPIEMPAIYEINYDYVSKVVSLELRNMFVACVYNDFAPAETCLGGTEGASFAGDPLAFHEEFVESEAFALDRVWTEDERTWLFTTEPVTIDVVRDGEEVSLDVTYSGQLKTDADGELEIILD